MTRVLQIQPRNPTAPSTLSLAGGRAAADRRPVRARSLILALAAGAVIGGLISLSAMSSGTENLTGAEIKTEAVAL